jgi:hypothetical protein
MTKVPKWCKGNGIYFLFSHWKELLRLYVKLFYLYFISCLLLRIFWSKEMKSPPSSIFVDMWCHVNNRGHAIFLSRQQLIILHSKLYSVCPSKYQDHSKPLKRLPINIWSTTNTFIWFIIPVVTSPKLPLMRSKIYPRWRTSHYFKWKYFKN